MAEPKTKGMVALVPTGADAERLAVEGGLPAEELHLTLLFLGDAADWDDDARTDLIAAMRTVADTDPVDGDGFALSAFNPSPDADHDTCIVLGVGGQQVDDIHAAVVDAADGPLPEQHAPWVAHTSLIYTDDLTVLPDLVDRCGPITFDRLRVAFAADVTDIPLTKTGAARALGNRRMGGTVSPLLRDPANYKRTPVFAAIPTSKQTESGVVTMRLYDPIDSWGEWWGVSAKEFATALDALPDDTKEIRLLINSPGGHAWEGLAILNALRNHPAKVVAIVEGIAASAASFIAAACDELRVMKNAEIFIHNAWSLGIGSADDLRKTADDLAHLDRNLASIYADKAGGTVDEWLAVMAADTWLSAEEAVEAGLADAVVEPPKGAEDAAKTAKARFDLSVFTARADATRPRATAPLPPDDPQPEPLPDPAPNPPAAEPDQPTTEEDPVSTLHAEVRQWLGLADDDPDDAAVVAAVKARQDEHTTIAAKLADAEARLAEQAKASADADEKVTQLTEQVAAMGEELAQIRADKAAATKATVLDAAQQAGKFPPADREKWAARYDKSPEVTTEVLAAIPAGSAVPVAATGHTGPAEPSGDIDAEWAQVAGLWPADTSSNGREG